MNAPEVEPREPRSVIPLLHCPLRLGLAASLTQFIYTHGGRILYHDQYVDAESNHYYTRLKWDISSFSMTEQSMTEHLRILRVYPNRIINIHHAFLPAFLGARPYHSARQRGVKIIGATSHYVTETLDAGPIIEQDVMRVTHRHSVNDLIRFGRDVEKVVLSRAIRSHISRKIIVHEGRTVVFD
jgi:formyltetrahydrofolate deformylase